MFESRSDDEFGRGLQAMLRGCPEIVVLDNVTRRLDAPALAGTITTGEVSARIVGTSDNCTVAIDCLLLIPANNPTLPPDMQRRVVPIWLEAPGERPEQRRGFRYPNLREFIRENRSLLQTCCVAVIQDWVSAGRPLSNTHLGGFESWAAVMGGILENAGISGLLQNLERFRDRFDAEAPWRAFLDLWAERLGDQAATVGDQLLDLADQVGLDLGTDDSRGLQIRLGKMLHHYRDRRVRACCGPSRQEEKQRPNLVLGGCSQRPRMPGLRVRGSFGLGDVESQLQSQGPPALAQAAPGPRAGRRRLDRESAFRRSTEPEVRTASLQGAGIGGESRQRSRSLRHALLHAS